MGISGDGTVGGATVGGGTVGATGRAVLGAAGTGGVGLAKTPGGSGGFGTTIGATGFAAGGKGATGATGGESERRNSNLVGFSGGVSEGAGASFPDASPSKENEESGIKETPRTRLSVHGHEKNM